MKILARVTVLSLLLLAGAARAQTSAVITFTHPSTGQVQEMVFDPDVSNWVLQIECYSPDGQPIHGLEQSYLYRYVQAVHAFARVDSASAVGLEGLPGEFTVHESGSYYVTTRNDVGESCAPEYGPISVRIDSTVTSVPITEAPGAPIEIRIFNAQGQLVPPGKRRASGVYYFQARWRSGLITTGKLPVLVR